MGYNTDDPVKRECYRVYYRALRSGLLVRQPCEVCGKKADGHHDDHTKPLAVRWLCRSHHMQVNPVRTPEHQRKAGRLGGLARKEQGLTEMCRAGGKTQGKVQGPKNVESGLLRRICSDGGKMATHIRWHVNRGIYSKKCELCFPD